MGQSGRKDIKVGRSGDSIKVKKVGGGWNEKVIFGGMGGHKRERSTTASV